MDEIDKNIEAFERLQNELEKDSMGRWVLFQNEQLIDKFDTFEDAAETGNERFEPGSYLIRQVGVSSITLPISFMSK